MVEEARDNASAQDIENFLDRVEEMREVILARVRSIAPEETSSTEDDLDYIIGQWRKLADRRDPDFGDAPLVYEAKYTFKRSEPRASDTALLRSHSDEDLTDAFPTLWSLRDVDVESDLYRER
jgi:hypothetical protein